MKHSTLQRPRSLLILLVVIALSSVTTASATNLGPVTIPIPNGRDHFANLTQIPYNKRHSAFWLTTNQNVTVAVAREVDEKQKLQTVGLTALQFGCQVAATNGGPFNADGSNSGPVVIQGRLVGTNAPTDFVGFGTTVNGEYLFGNYHDFDDDRIWEFVTGFGWLVYNGTSVVISNEDDKRAPRTIVGVDKNDNLISLVIDGCERCFSYNGMTLHEASIFLQDRGAKYAISLDGGSSSTFVSQLRVANQPTCTGLPIVCERPVATAICISDRKNSDVLEVQ
ncbi:unnamed protein product [Cylindrotheca closterium]|uniref:Phosphodiester glycosidase domain-containing protein n=1 Tax=Cylindrotheca closterium TaxID=2856 RepID=A0AAD2CFG2_9STRA|nr:unnamed protein product [Cylindrotheca closterium]